MSNEPGERRRRRELERARELATQQAAAAAQSAGVGQARPSVRTPDVAANPPAQPPAPPVSRRVRRETERVTALASGDGAAPNQPASPPPLATAVPDQRTPATRTPATRPAESGGETKFPVPGFVPDGPDAPATPTEPGAAPQRPARVPAQLRPAPPLREQAHPAPPTPSPPLRPAQAPPPPSRPADDRPAENGFVARAKPSADSPDPAGLAGSPPQVPAALSRRARRTAAGPADSVRTPVVRPPDTTGTIRSVAPDAERPVKRPAGASSTGARGYPPVAPRRPSVPRAAPTAAVAPPAVAPPAVAPPAVAPATAAPDSPVAWNPLPPAAAAATARPARSPIVSAETGGGAPLTPRWGNVPSGSFDAITRPEADEAPVDTPDPADSGATDPTSRPRRASYTWLQLGTLALVAFVLGFLVWLLIRGASEPLAAGAFAPTPTTSTSGAAWPHQGAL